MFRTVFRAFIRRSSFLLLTSLVALGSSATEFPVSSWSPDFKANTAHAFSFQSTDPLIGHRFDFNSVSRDQHILLVSGDGGGGDREAFTTQRRQQGNISSVSDAPVIRFENEMRDTRAECGNLPAEYQADCLQQGLSTGAAVLTGSENAEARREIQSAQRKIKRLVDQNVDRSKPPIRRGGKTYRAVKKSAVAKVNREARRIVAETETKLLRSASRSSARKTHYARIARAVGSTKTILRS